MKAVGIVHKLDSLGRYVLPKELRSRLNIDIGDPLEEFVDGNSILSKKYEPSLMRLKMSLTTKVKTYVAGAMDN